MRQPNVSVYGSRSCPETSRATRFLDAQKIAYEFKSVDDFPEYNDYIAGLNGGTRAMPTIRIDNDVFINPTDEELRRAVDEAAKATAG